MTRCKACGEGTMTAALLPSYEMDLGGLTVRLVNTVIRDACDRCDEATIEVPDLEGLAKAAALARALTPFRLAGKEIRFLRRALDMTGREFAEAMELTPETVSRWETGLRGVGGDSEKLLRHNVCALLHRQVNAIAYEPAVITRMKILDVADGFEFPPLVFRRVVVKGTYEAVEAWDRMAA
ncbi:MAG: helix-turn-helix domain-containing protein [Acetobacteraceae bacterium]|nr:helix-turn-helix domain-containing protein [Acetobacteraceae bacterium]